MTRAELKTLYVEAAIKARVKPQKSEEDLWWKEFEYTDQQDMHTAINEHFALSEWMPKQQQLRPLVDQALRARLARASSQQQLVRRQCETCGCITVGFNDPGDTVQRSCQRRLGTEIYDPTCGGTMIEIYRGSYATEAA